MSKHTPGPWFYRVDSHGDDKEGEIDTMDSPLSEPIAIIPHDDCNTKQYRMSNANARLIAASPCLLEACKAAVSTGGLNHIVDKWALDLCQAAIRKAEGGAA